MEVLVTKVTFLVKEQNVSVIYTDCQWNIKHVLSNYISLSMMIVSA